MSDTVRMDAAGAGGGWAFEADLTAGTFRVDRDRSGRWRSGVLTPDDTERLYRHARPAHAGGDRSERTQFILGEERVALTLDGETVHLRFASDGHTWGVTEGLWEAALELARRLE